VGRRAGRRDGRMTGWWDDEIARHRYVPPHLPPPSLLTTTAACHITTRCEREQQRPRHHCHATILPRLPWPHHHRQCHPAHFTTATRNSGVGEPPPPQGFFKYFFCLLFLCSQVQEQWRTPTSSPPSASVAAAPPPPPLLFLFLSFVFNNISIKICT
jgi:hypothetical protein